MSSVPIATMSVPIATMFVPRVKAGKQADVPKEKLGEQRVDERNVGTK